MHGVYIVVAFPEHMDSPVARLHPEGVHVPPILPAYNKYMCAVDRTNQLGKTMTLIENLDVFGYVL